MLRYPADRRTLVFIGAWYVLFVALYAADPSGWGFWLGLVALASLSWICAVITHNTVHCPIFLKKAHNRVFQVVLTLTYGHPVSAYVPGHNLSHHKFTQTARDAMRTTKVRSRFNALNLLLFFPTVAPAIVKGERAFVQAMRTQKPAWFKQLRIEQAFFFGVSALLLVVDWRRALVWWYVPHLWAAWGIISINYLQHDGCDETDPYNHSRNFVGRLFGWFTFNNGYHSIHHAHPGLHWSLLPEAHAREIAPHINPALDAPSIAVYVFKAFIWPGKRRWHDGGAYRLPPKRADETWVPGPGQPKVAFSMGAEGMD